MLALTRRIGESIIIDGVIEIKIVAVSGGQVRLGVNAPRNIVVDRKEIHDSKKEDEHNAHHNCS